MSKILVKLFGSRKKADSLSELHNDLKEAIENLEDLEQNWHNKVKEVNNFLGGWNVESEDLQKIKKHINVVEEILEISQEKLESETKINFRIAEITESLIIKIRNSDVPDKLLKLRFLDKVSRTVNPNIEDDGAYSNLFVLFKRQAKHWRDLKNVLQKEIHFINVYSQEDIGLIRFNIHQFIEYLKEEGRILGIEEKEMRLLYETEKFLIKADLILIKKKDDELETRRKLLHNWGFRLNMLKELDYILVSQWEYTVAIQESTKLEHVRPLFFDAIPFCKDIILEYGLSELAKIAKISRSDDVYYIFRYGLPNCQKSIKEIGLIEVGKSLSLVMQSGPRKYVIALFKFGLNEFEEMMIKHGIYPVCMDLLRIAQAASEHSFSEYFYKGLLTSKGVMMKYSLHELSLIAEHIEAKDVSAMFYNDFSEREGMRNCTELVMKFGFADLIKILSVARRKDAYFILSICIPQYCREIIFDYGFEFLVQVAEAVKPEHIMPIFWHYIPTSKEAIDNEGLNKIAMDLVKISNQLSEEEGNFIFTALAKCGVLIKIHGLFAIGEPLIKIYKSIDKKNLPTLFNSLDILNNVVTDTSDFIEVGFAITKNITLFESQIILSLFISEVHTKTEFYEKLNEVKGLNNRRLFDTVQGLNSMGFLCCHVTNAFAGGAAVYDKGPEAKIARSDAFQNIINDINNKFDYNPSISVIKPGLKSSVAFTDSGYIGGSIGVIYDYGYVYQAFGFDASTQDIVDTKTGKSFRSEGERLQYIRNKSRSDKLMLSKRDEDPRIVVNFSTSLVNELLIRKWTISGIFFTKGCHQWVIDKLVKISNELSFKEYINGAYWYRETKKGVPEKIMKLFPIYEIDTSNNKWIKYYVPKRD